jgi:molybdopterin synthase catalytic subunit
VVGLQSAPIDVAALVERVRADGAGAVATFLGTVRDHNRGRRVLHLIYEAYSDMARSEMESVVRQARARFDVSGIALVHRTGRLEIGEVAVAVAVAAAHRAHAMDACRFVIDTLKKTVPIWKKEVFEGGAAWIEGPGDAPPEDQAKSSSSRSSSSMPR